MLRSKIDDMLCIPCMNCRDYLVQKRARIIAGDETEGNEVKEIVVNVNAL